MYIGKIGIYIDNLEYVPRLVFPIIIFIYETIIKKNDDLSTTLQLPSYWKIVRMQQNLFYLSRLFPDSISIVHNHILYS